MCQESIVATAEGHVRGVHDWTEGFKPLRCPRRRLSEDDVQALSLMLARRGRREESNEILERFCDGYCIERNAA